MKINKYKIMLIIAIISIICVLGTKTYAETLDLLVKGTIAVTLKNNEEVIKGAEITIYKVADAKIEDNNIKFPYNELFKDFDVDINDINSDETIKNLAKTALENNAKGITKVTDETGKIEFTELETGAYIVVQAKSVNNYYDFKSYLVKIPYDDNGVWKYNVLSEPKVEKKEQSPNKPQDNDIASDHDDNVNKAPEKQEELIKTGQNNWPILIFSFVGILCLIIGLVIIIKRRNNEEQ